MDITDHVANAKNNHGCVLGMKKAVVGNGNRSLEWNLNDLNV